MKDIFTEYIWFLITLVGALMGMQMLIILFFNKSDYIYKIVNVVIGGLM